MNESVPKVSIVLPTYNGAKYIRQSIDSCLNQTYKNIELIIVDDGSVDETPEIIKYYQDERIRYLRHNENNGIPNALNTGFTKATGEYLTWTSDDNHYAEHAIEKMLSFLKRKNCEFVYCDYYRFKDDNPSNGYTVKLPDVLALENRNDVGACFLYSRTVMEIVGNYDPDAELAEDYNYWVRVSKNFPMCHLGELLYFYREHSESLSLSRFYEVRVVDILVRMKNEVLSIDLAVDSLIGLITKKSMRISRINKILNKIIFSRKIKKILKEFNMGKLGFRETKIALINIVKGG